EGHPLLTVERETRLPLLTAFSSSAPGDIEREVEQSLKDGFRTFKIKVGKSAEDDARRVKLIQRAIAGRATMRLDANRAYSEADARRFRNEARSGGLGFVRAAVPGGGWGGKRKGSERIARSLNVGRANLHTRRREACLRDCERGLLQTQAQAFWRPRSASRGARCGSRMGNGGGARRWFVFGVWMLDVSLC